MTAAEGTPDVAVGLPAEVASAEERSLVSSDPAVLRALAHPLRVEIMAVLDDLQEATATEIAERVGESPSNCSFHLRQLEKAGFIVRGEQRGTAKPWRPAHHGRNLSPDVEDPASVRASATIGALYVQREASRVVDYLTSSAATESPEWLETMTVNTTEFWATQEEMREMVERIATLADHLQGRSHDPSKRPPGSRRARMLVTLNPDPTAEPTPEA
ncbi:ArsR/SmtB family transcription factor [Agrococcus jejuensis]|uniref:ArsR/SmtB family transcription factor n=1 Tax=Agrococcus jejuensis TaxID=399736 RepID=UPI0011AA6F5D|nr:winged helix-turn-helix domain-containing protein [Agrococcus jejuensis]